MRSSNTDRVSFRLKAKVDQGEMAYFLSMHNRGRIPG